jgi:hypothetical protein
MSAGDQRNTLIVEMTKHSNQQTAHFQSLNDSQLAGAGAVMVFLLKGGIRDANALKTMSDDDQRNTAIVEVAAQTHLGKTLQGNSNIDLVALALGQNLQGSLTLSTFIRGVLLAGGFRTHHDLIAMSDGDQRNTLIVEMTKHSNQQTAHFQSLNDFQLAGAGAAMVFLLKGGIRDANALKTMSDDDQRNTAIVEVAAQTHLGNKLQGLRTIDVVAAALGVDPVFFVPAPPIHHDPANTEQVNPELGDPTGSGKPKPDPPKDPPPEAGKTKNNPDKPDIQQQFTDGPPVPATGCFIGSTPVLMADGLTKAIDTITVGDHVVARDEKTGITAVGAVSRIFRHRVSETLLLQIDGGEVVETTTAHRFAAEERGFVSAGQLRPGDRLSTHDERGLGVVSSETRSGDADVYNLSVDRFYTFFIGGARLWVHNVKDATEPKTP